MGEVILRIGEGSGDGSWEMDLYEAIMGMDARGAESLAARLGLRGDEVRLGEDGWTCMHFAARFGMVGVLRVLAGNGGDPDVGDDDGRTPLMFHGNLDTARVLLEIGAAPERMDKYGNVAIDYVMRTEDEEYLEDFRNMVSTWRAEMEGRLIDGATARPGGCMVGKRL